MKNETEEPKLEDMLTELDPPYESKEELKIGRMLDQYSIPFFYKQATIIYDQGKNKIWKPSFTLYSYSGLVIDYVPGSEQGKTRTAAVRLCAGTRQVALRLADAVCPSGFRTY